MYWRDSLFVGLAAGRWFPILIVIQSASWLLAVTCLHTWLFIEEEEEAEEEEENDEHGDNDDNKAIDDRRLTIQAGVCQGAASFSMGLSRREKWIQRRQFSRLDNSQCLRMPPHASGCLHRRRQALNSTKCPVVYAAPEQCHTLNRPVIILFKAKLLFTLLNCMEEVGNWLTQLLSRSISIHRSTYPLTHYLSVCRVCSSFTWDFSIWFDHSVIK